MAKEKLLQMKPGNRKQDPLVIKVEAVKAVQSKTGLFRRSCNLDLTALRDGRKKSGRGPAFSGRPHLAMQVGSAIQELADTTCPSKGSLEGWRAACTHLWLSLDEYEKSHAGCGRIDSIDQLPGQIWTAFCFDLADGPQNAAHNTFSCLTKLLRQAKPGIHLGAQPFTKTPIVARRQTTNPYPPETMREMKEAFRKERYALLQRFEAANALADGGLLPATTLEHYHRKSRPFDDVWAPENTLRFVRDLLLPTLPNTQAIQQRYRIWTVQIGITPDAPVPVPVEGTPTRTRSSANGAGLIGLYRHFIPSYRDLVPLAAEAMLEGLNPQTVMDYDRERCIRDTIDPELVILSSRKSRANGKLIEPPSTREPDSLFQIISTAIAVTKPLHEVVDAELEKLRARGKHADVERIEHLEFLRNRVWLTLKAKDVGVGWLRQDIDFRRAVNEVLTRYGVKENGVQARWDSRRCRDRKASNVYDLEKSLEAVRVALHHKSKNMSEVYVTTPERTLSDNAFLRQRFEDLASFQSWPKLPATVTPQIASSLEMIVTAKGREWLASRHSITS